MILEAYDVHEVKLCHGTGRCGRKARATCLCGVVTDCECGSVVLRHVCGRATGGAASRFMLAVIRWIA